MNHAFELRPRTPISRLWRALACALLVACVDQPTFEPSELVDRPRVLAVIAEPPEVQPGRPVTLSILLAGFEDTPPTSIEWFACGSFTSTMGGRQYGDEADRKGCGDGELSVSLGEGEVGQIPGEFTQLFFDNAELAAETFGAFLPPGSVELVREQVGLAALIEARVNYGDGKVFRAVKRVVVKNGEGHVNPPPPAFAIAPLSDDDGDAGSKLPVDIVGEAGSFRCEPADGAPLVLAPGVRVELIPETPPGEDEAWLEEYSVLNARGELEPRTERAFYSWYSDGGRFADDVTKSPLRNNEYRAPGKCGDYHLWLFVQDGHGGGSACALDFSVKSQSCETEDAGLPDAEPQDAAVPDSGAPEAGT